MWKLGIDFLYNGSAEVDGGIADGAEIEGVSWSQINLSGKYPARLAHHQGVLQETSKEFIIYGGITGLDSSDVLYVVNLNNFNFTAIPAAQ